MANSSAPAAGAPAASPAATTADLIAKYTPKPPKAVAEGAARAEALQRQLNGSDIAPQGGAENGPGSPPEGQPLPEAGPPPEASPGPPQAIPGASQPGSAPQEDSWEQRARSALGRLETQLNENRQLHGRVDQLEGMIATMQATGQQPKPETQPPQPVTLVSQEERDQYGDEMLSVIGKRAEEAFSPKIQALEQTITELRTRLDGVGQVMTRSAVKSVYDTLAEHVPNWQQINKSPQFAAWSNQLEPYSGVQRSKLIRQAFDRHEGDRVVRFFEGFLSEAAALDPASVQPGSGTAPSPNGQAGNGKIPLEAFAAPGRARSVPPELPPEKPTYARPAISRHYDEKRRGLWRGREADWEAIERDMILAGQENRISQ